MSSELEEAITSQVEKIGAMVKQETMGYYVVPDISMANWDDQRVRLLNQLLFILTAQYPQYQWWTTESFFGPGIRINWRLKI